MKKDKNMCLFLLTLFIVLFLFPIFACKGEGKTVDNTPDPLLEGLAFEFETAYTEEQHVQRIMQRTEERFANEIATDKIKDIHVEIVYSYYTEDPEYFLVEIEYNDFFTGSLENPYYSDGDSLYLSYTTNRKHLIGRINKDEYLIYPWYSTFIDGPSVYSARGYADNRKYIFIYTYSVKSNGEVYDIFSGDPKEYNYLFLGLAPWAREPWISKIEQISVATQAHRLKESRENNPYTGLNEYIYTNYRIYY